MGYEKLYFENSTYKYCQKTHASINTKKSVTEHFQQRSGKICTTCKMEPFCISEDGILMYQLGKQQSITENISTQSCAKSSFPCFSLEHDGILTYGLCLRACDQHYRPRTFLAGWECRADPSPDLNNEATCQWIRFIFVKMR